MDRNGRLAVTALVVAVLTGGGAWAQESVATRSSPPIAIDEGRSVIVLQSRSRMPGAVLMTAASASVDINDQLATSRLELTLTNPTGRPQEAEVIIPVPDGVTVRSFQYDGTGPEPTAKLLPKEEARRIYDSIVSRTRDPGLLEFAGTSMIRTCVFPVPAGASQKVRLTYEQLLNTEGDRVDYFLPRSDSLSASGPAWSIELSVKSARPVATVYSPSHQIIATRVGPGEFRVQVQPESAALPGSLRLSYLLGAAEAEAPSATLMAYPDPTIAGGNEGYFLLLAGVPDAPGDRQQAVKREVTVVIDRSGSMRGEKMEQARAAALQVVDGLEPDEAFNIVDYSDSIYSFADKPVIKDAKTIEEARAYIRNIKAEGGTNLNEALLTALRPQPTEGMLPIVIFLTDGLPTVGTTDEVAIREGAKAANAFGRRIFSFGVGFDVNTPLLSGIARTSRGKPTFVLPSENVEMKVSDVFRGMKGPVLAAPRLAAIDANGHPVVPVIRDLQPNEIPDLFEGDQLVVLGRYNGTEPLRFSVAGDYFGKPRTFTYQFDLANASPRNAYVGRLWATRRIASLTEAIRQKGAQADPANDPATKELVDEVVRLSGQFGILTEYTSFLATDPNDRLAVAAPASAAAKESSTLWRTMNDERTGAASMRQDVNAQLRMASVAPAQVNYFYDEKMKMVEFRNVQNVGAQTLIFRNGRWLDARLLSKENESPQQTVTFGTPEYERVVDALIREGNQAVLTNTGEIYMLVEGQRTLIKQGA